MTSTQSPQHGLWLREHVPHRFEGHRRVPSAIGASATELWASGIFAATARCLAEDGLEVPALGVDPATEERGRVFAQRRVEGVFGTRVCQCLDDKRDLVVQSRDLSQPGGVLWVLGQSEHLSAERVFHGHLNVVDGGSGVFVEFFIDTDGVWKLDRVKGTGMVADALWNLWEEHLVSAEDLWMLVSDDLVMDKVEHTDRKR